MPENALIDCGRIVLAYRNHEEIESVEKILARRVIDNTVFHLVEWKNGS